MTFIPSRDAALERLTYFSPRMGRDYASSRNYDTPPHSGVSRLSPYLRHRILTEEEVLHTALVRHSPSAAEKFIQEVYWRTYWKGWLEQRSSVWTMYRADLNAALNHVQTASGLRSEWEAACAGDTGIDCFDHWARELADTGYLHNHARMWFASIWVFTLRLPWELGADFFMRHLLDGDAASNTLGWRWVAGLQTAGKTYLARPDNIAKYTKGAFNPKGLAKWAAPVDRPPNPDRGPVPVSTPVPSGRIGVLISEDDLMPDWLLDTITPSAIATYNGTAHRSPLHVSTLVTNWVDDAVKATTDHLSPSAHLTDAAGVDAWAAEHNLDAIVMSYAPVGGSADDLAQVKTPIAPQIRPYDAAAWPYAAAGFFKFKMKIPKLLTRYDNQLTLI
jgi:deoxyribodipyrimidine photo-lyase